MWKLVIEDDEGKRTVVPLTRDDYTLGRREGNTIRLTERNVSRDHAMLRKKAGANGNGANGTPPNASANGAGSAFTLHDCSSYNGVYVNGVRVVDGQELQHGDLIQIGDYRLILQDDAISDQPAPVGQTAEDGKTTLPLGVTRGSLLLERPNRLVMLAGPTPGSEFPLTLERMTIGRAEDASISINHNSVSRMHCEIHALGESRFEIVDKGSSNGVRVNGADLRRGIIEAGDIIELGDVRFKFVGAGQVFVPGVSESAQLEAIGDRAAGQALGQTGTSAKAVWFFVVSVVALVLAAAFMFLRKPSQPDIPTPVHTVADTPESQVIAEAKQLCGSGDCERAHERLQQGIALSSPLRDSVDFKLVEGAWAMRMLERANNETDLARRRAMLDAVAKAPSVDPTQRKIASDRLQLLEDKGQAPNTLPSAVNPYGDGTATIAPVPPGTPPPPANPPVASTPKATPNPNPQPPRVNPQPPPQPPKPPAPTANTPAERARELMLKQDLTGAKNLLLPRVSAGKGTREEAQLLKLVCQDLKDAVCVTMAKEKLAQ